MLPRPGWVILNMMRLFACLCPSKAVSDVRNSQQAKPQVPSLSLPDVPKHIISLRNFVLLQCLKLKCLFSVYWCCFKGKGTHVRDVRMMARRALRYSFTLFFSRWLWVLFLLITVKFHNQFFCSSGDKAVYSVSVYCGCLLSCCIFHVLLTCLFKRRMND